MDTHPPLVKVSHSVVQEFVDAHRKARMMMTNEGLLAADLPDFLQKSSGSLNGYIEGIADISGMDLRGFALADIDLTGVYMPRCILSGMVLWNTNFEGAVLDGCALDSADLTWANLSYASVNHADLRHAILDRLQAYYASFRKANMAGAHCLESNFNHANLQSTDLTGAVLNKSDLREANLKETQLFDAKIEHALLDGAIVTETLLDPAFLLMSETPKSVLSSALMLSDLILHAMRSQRS